ncbi:MAG: hypothetical protein U0Q16_03470 [Bryobacteraceae bacterium]
MSALAIPAAPYWLEYGEQTESAYPSVHVARGVTFDEIWQLFRDSGFLYPEKIARLEPVLPEIRRSVRALLDANGHLGATIAVRHGDALDAQVSVLRWPSRTWCVQHLAARPLSARALYASAQVTLAMTRYMLVRRDVEYVKICFRPDNAWPARVFGDFARQVEDGVTSTLRVFHYLVAPPVLAAVPEEFRVRHASSAADFEMVERWFADRGRRLEASANEYEAWRGGRAAFAGEYFAAGLERRRETLIAERNGAPAGFALLEMGSPGLNFSELTNAFTVHPLGDDDDAARHALAVAARNRYTETGRLQCIALEDSERLAAFAAAGFEAVKQYCFWTFHRSQIEPLEQYFLNLFSSRRRRR